MASRKGQPRIERDEFGELTIPAGSYWGAGTARALELFTAQGRACHPNLVEAMIQVKKAVAITNGDLGLLEKQVASAITQVCDEFLSGQWRDQIVVDAIGGGAGVALSININEFIAGRASEILGDAQDEQVSVRAEEHVNLTQSNNDVYMTAMRVAVLTLMKKLQFTVLEIERLLRRKSLEFERILKVGRVALRDSVPVTLGQEFNSYGSTIERSLRRIKDASTSLEEVNLGGREVGTGFNTIPEFATLAVRNLNTVTNLNLKSAEDYFRATQTMSDFVALSSSLKELAVDLAKISADLRLMSSGPQGGFGEIKLPDMILQPSPLLPGVMPKAGIAPMTEALSMVCYQVIGNDLVVSLASQAGQLESNSLSPIIIENILQSISMLQKVLVDFNHHCLIKITANSKRCKELMDSSGALVALLSIELGYQNATDLIKQAEAQGVDIRELLQSSQAIPRATLDKIFHYKFLTTPHLLIPASPVADTDGDTN